MRLEASTAPETAAATWARQDAPASHLVDRSLSRRGEGLATTHASGGRALRSHARGLRNVSGQVLIRSEAPPAPWARRGSAARGLMLCPRFVVREDCGAAAAEASRASPPSRPPRGHVRSQQRFRAKSQRAPLASGDVAARLLVCNPHLFVCEGGATSCARLSRTRRPPASHRRAEVRRQELAALEPSRTSGARHRAARPPGSFPTSSRFLRRSRMALGVRRRERRQSRTRGGQECRALEDERLAELGEVVKPPRDRRKTTTLMDLLAMI